VFLSFRVGVSCEAPHTRKVKPKQKMKKIILSVLFLFAIAIGVNCQQWNTVFANDTTKGAQTKYATSTNQVLLYRGLVTFQFTSAHDVATVTLEGNNKGDVWYPVDTIACSGATAVNNRFTVINPEFVYYRLRKLGNGGDTCYFTNQRFIYKY
jgi:hypothetical protein